MVGKEHGEKIRQMYIDNPELREQVSIREKQKYIDEPWRKDLASRNMKEYWSNIPGGYSAWLSTFPPDKQREIDRARATSGKYR